MRKTFRSLIIVTTVCLIVSLFPIGALAADIPNAVNILAAPQGIDIIGQSVTCATINWLNVPDAEGYEVYRAENGGAYTLVYTTNYSVFADTTLITEQTYEYKIRAFKTVDDIVVYSEMSDEISVSPSFTLYYQGDSSWHFSDEVKKKACVLTAYAIVIKNMGIDVTPRTLYKANGGTSINLTRLKDRLGVEPVSALADNSALFDGFDGRSTSIKSKSKNYEEAVTEALKLHPEGVILYFKKGDAAHAIVACKVDEDGTIYYSDPGRNKGRLLTFKETWVSHHHHMSYSNLADMITLDLSSGANLILE